LRDVGEVHRSAFGGRHGCEGEEREGSAGLGVQACRLSSPWFQKRPQVLKAIIEYQDGHTGEEKVGEEMLQWPKAIGSNPAGDTKISLEALGRLTEAWGYSRKRTNNKIMPFIAEVNFQGKG